MNSVYVLMRINKIGDNVPVSVYSTREDAERNADISTYVCGPVPLCGLDLLPKPDMYYPPFKPDVYKPPFEPSFSPIHNLYDTKSIDKNRLPNFHPNPEDEWDLK